MVNQTHLQTLGFRRDMSAPDGVNRWYREDGRREPPYVIGQTYHASVTLSADGSRTLYGRINFHGDHGRILEFRRFEKAVSVADFAKFLDRRCLAMPDGIERRDCRCAGKCLLQL